MSSSSESGSSDEETTAKPVISSSDSDAGPKPSKKKLTSSSSDSDSEPEKEKKKPSQPKNKVLTKRKRKAPGSSDDDQVDDSLFVDKEDKARWKALSELEKEQEIFNRMEARESARAREEIAQQLAKKAKKNEKGGKGEKRRKDGGGSGPSSPKQAAGSDSESDNPEFHRPSDIHRKHKEKNAMDALKSKRKEIEKKNARNAALSIDAVFGANSGSSSSSESSESSRSSSSSRDSSPERGSEQEKVVRKDVDSLIELRKARLSRHKLSLMIHAPFFNATVIGCYVRLGQGQMSGSESKYKIWKIVNVEDGNKVYEFEGKRTNKHIKCQNGRQERLFRMQFVSNSEFHQVEFEEWLASCKENKSVPTVDVMDKKKLDIEKAVNHKFSDKEVDQILKEKSKFQKVPRNFAMTKAALAKQKELAQQTGDIREALRIQQEIDDIERHADELDKQRTKAISAIAFINHRNRTQIKNQVLSGKLKIEENSQDDPFTRKKGGMRIVSGSKTKLNEGGVSESSSASNLADVGKPTQAPVSGKQMNKKSADLSSLHNFDLDIDLTKLMDFNPSQEAAGGKRPSISSSKPPGFGIRRVGGSDGAAASTSSSSAI
uniref:Plus3 domain-containing protein n=1 Tax=Caenorhabditis japonica TaxID=281687 RepID=A0A8R1DRC7_CAEJA